MPADRFFTPNLFAMDQLASLDGKEFHHLKNVTRTKPGEQVEVVNGLGELAVAVVEEVERHHATLRILKLDKSPPPRYTIILAQAIPRIQRLDFILEKGTELGLTEFRLFPGDRSERKSLTEHQLERLRALTVAAMKQCGRLYLPTLSVAPPLAKWKPLTGSPFFGDLAPEAPTFFSEWQQHPPREEIVFFIGPESGFSGEEELLLHQLGAKGVKLHHNILRTDTAALTSLSLISQMMML